MLLTQSRHKISVAGAQLKHVVAAGEKGFDVACRLTQALPVLDQGDTDEPVPVFAKADTRRYRHIGLFEQQLREREAANRAEGRRDRRPSEHCRVGCRYLPPGLAQPIDEDVAARAITLTDFSDTVLRAIERRGRRNLDGRERAVVEVRL